MDKKMHKIPCKYLVITLIGFIVLLMGRGIGTGIKLYPDYVQNYEIGPEFQYYTLNTFYGAGIEAGTENIFFKGYRIPIFSIAGYILIMYGFLGLKDRSRVFTIGKWMAFMAIFINVILNILPFVMTGSRLCYVAMCIGIASLGIELSVGYFLICGICDTLRGTAFKTDRVTLGITWFISVVCRIIVFVTTWVQLPNLTMVYNIILLWLWIFFIYTVWKLRSFVTGEIKFQQ